MSQILDFDICLIFPGIQESMGYWRTGTTQSMPLASGKPLDVALASQASGPPDAPIATFGYVEGSALEGIYSVVNGGVNRGEGGLQGSLLTNKGILGQFREIF